MPGLPRGTVTFLFTDIQGSTQLWQADPTVPMCPLSCITGIGENP
jgi:class 3 adenylate cyclase